MVADRIASRIAVRVIGIVKWAGVAIIAMTVAVIAVLHSIDVSSYREEIAAGLGKATGRDVSIGGDIDLSISLRPAVVVEEVAIANTGWGSRPRMMTVRRAEARIELMPLITGDVRVTSLVLLEPDILLETNAEGVSNWRFGPSSNGETTTAEDEAGIGHTVGRADAAPSGASRIPVFNHVEIHRGSLTYRDGMTGEEMRLDLTEVTVDAPSATAPVSVEATGAWNRAPFSVSGSIEPLSNLGSGLPLRLAAEIEAFGFNARVTGAISKPHEFDGLDLELDVSGSNIASLAAVAGPGLPDLGPLSLEAGVKGSTEKLEIDSLRLVLASSDVAGTMTVSGIGGRPHVAGTLASTRLDLAELLSEPEAGGTSAAGVSVESDETKSGGVFPDDPLPLGWLAAVNLDLALTIDRLVTAALPLGGIKGGVMLDNGSMTVRPFSVSVAESRIDGELRLDASRKPPLLAIAIDAPALDLGRLLKEVGVSDLVEGKATISANLAGTGRSVAALAASLNGDIRMLASNARLDTRAPEAVIGGASAVLGTLVAGKEQWTVVDCAVSSIEIKDGVATSQATLVDMEYSTVTVGGTIDLASETLDLVVEPRAKSVTLNVAVPVHVQGSLASPIFRPGTGATLKKLGGLLGLFIFPPAAIAGLAELGGGDSECMRIAIANRDTGSVSGSRSSPAVPEIPASAVEAITEGAEDLLEGFSRGLKGIFGRSD